MLILNGVAVVLSLQCVVVMCRYFSVQLLCVVVSVPGCNVLTV